MMKNRTYLISAICTPLNNDETLHEEGLRAHLEDQWRHGIPGVFVGGTMGLMQMLTDQTYRQLVEHCVSMSAGRGEVLVGVGDTSFARTRDRIRLVENLPIDGVVAITPYFRPFSQSELVDYYCSLADISKKPLYLYNLPCLTKVALEFDTVLKISRHPNIRGIKSSAEAEWSRQLIEMVGDRFRIIVAQPFLVDVLARSGICEHLDGIFSVAPHWAAGIAAAADRGDWELARSQQQRLSTLLRMLRERYPVFPACSVLLNARGIPGNIAPAPLCVLSEEQRQQLLHEPIVQELLGK
jgi:4-hydroxy-tetrahydrodipicolinate synthase